MDDDAVDRYTDAECETIFARLFPQGFAGQDVLNEIAPEGWENSPLAAVFHPSLDQVYAETLQLHRNIQTLPWRDKQEPPRPEPTRHEVAETYRETPINTEREVRELIGKCLWDVFSDNHDVVGPDGRTVDIGSFRGAGGFIADCLNRQGPTPGYDYIDFYMGTIWIARRADLTPVYQMIFHRLAAYGFDWRYAFPRLGLVDLRPLRAELGLEVQDDERRDREVAALRESLDTSYRAAIEAAQNLPPPLTVQAYQSVYGHYPQGWPPSVEPPAW